MLSKPKLGCSTPKTVNQSPTLSKPTIPKAKSSRPVLHNITNVTSKTNTSTNSNTLQCSFCNMVYSTRAGLYKHLIKNHSEEQEIKASIKCLENCCTFSGRVLSDLRTHLQMEHQIPMEYEEKIFNSHQGIT